MKRVLLFLFFVLIIPTVLAIPTNISIEGVLEDNSNSPITTSKSVRFSIYPALTGGTAIFTQTNTIVPDSKGRFNQILSNVNLNFTNQFYLGVKISTDAEATPRVTLTSVPYSFKSNSTDYLIAGGTLAGNTFAAGDLIPSTNKTLSFGTSTWHFLKGWFTDIFVGGKITSDDVLYLDSDVNISGNLLSQGDINTTGKMNATDFFVIDEHGHEASLALVSHNLLEIEDDAIIEHTNCTVNATGGQAKAYVFNEENPGDHIELVIDKTRYEMSDGLSIDLTEGVRVRPQYNWVYTDDGSTLSVSVTEPTGEFAYLCNVYIANVTGTVIDFHTVEDEIPSNYEFIKRAYKRDWLDSAVYDNGIVPTISTNDLVTTSGIVFTSMTPVTFVARDTSGATQIVDEYFNHYSDFSEVITYSDNSSISNNKYSKLVVFGAIEDKSDVYFVNRQQVPGTEYNSISKAEVDEEQKAVFICPTNLRTQCFLIAYLVVKVSGGSSTIQTLSNGAKYVDLRGSKPSALLTASSGSYAIGLSDVLSNSNEADNNIFLRPLGLTGGVSLFSNGNISLNGTLEWGGGSITATNLRVNGYIDSDDYLYLDDDVNISGFLNVSGDIRSSGKYYGDGSELTGITATETDPLWSTNFTADNYLFNTGDTMTGNLTLNEDLIPDTDASGNIGRNILRWLKGWFIDLRIDGKITSDDTVYIDDDVNVSGDLNVSGNIELGESGILIFNSTGFFQYNLTHFKEIRTDSAVPKNTIAAFYQTTCPDGWIPADGTSGTPDLNNEYNETSWLFTNDWTNVHLGTTNGSDSDFFHGLDAPLSDIIVKVLISTDGTDANSFEVLTSFYDYNYATVYEIGHIIYAIDNNNIKIQTGEHGVVRKIGDTPAETTTVVSQAWYYKISAQKKRAFGGNSSITYCMKTSDDSAETAGLIGSSGLYNVFVQNTSKNFGIGTTAPSSKLEVDGNITVTGSLNISGNDNVLTKNSTAWLHTSDWTNVHLGTTNGTDSNFFHGLNAPLTELSVKVFISTDGTDANSFEVPQMTRDTDAGGYISGTTIYYIDDDNIKVQTGLHGLQKVNDNGAHTQIDTEAWYYKIKVWKLG